ncbi:50S ribosomal protein L18 [Candidatus Roizmanbacteria bacterium RIFCSPHIGHO2_12_FULL_41_11]|uniref:Large ribosomal subunit protein uL18 n=1 Tax=Candidatus Roizmanbacteria bacterium RIFCSPHIGHO2_12_FULL_41_11 TaxID=1802052 RepID=A0A1F7I4N1_9BACT|nr:MAG: 50S ribosomal protein L18 [Candidatus Roizmanbacteria bacterium RIFCSPHIGHO2_12_FULL_41_11]
MININRQRTDRRKRRVSANIHGTIVCPRICVYRSNKNIYVQAIDDDKKITITAVFSKTVKDGKMTKSVVAKAVGKKLASELLQVKIKQAVFDRSSYAYNGRVKALAEGLREGGIKV